MQALNSLLILILVSPIFVWEVSYANVVACSDLLSINTSVAKSMTNQKGHEWPEHKIKFWNKLLPDLPKDSNLEQIPEYYHQKTVRFEEMTLKGHLYPETSMALDILEPVSRGLVNFQKDTYAAKLGRYKKPNRDKAVGDTTLTREAYRFLHVTRPESANLILRDGPRFSPALESIETSPRSGVYEHSSLGQFFYSAFYTTMERSYSEPYAQRLYSQDKGKYHSRWAIDDPLSPVLVELLVQPTAKVLDLRRGFYIYSQGFQTSPGRDAYYNWYLSLGTKELETFVLSRVSRALIDEFPIESHKELWLAPQTFAHLIGADIVYYEAGLKGGRTVGELNIINPKVILGSEIAENPMETPYLDFRY